MTLPEFSKMFDEKLDLAIKRSQAAQKYKEINGYFLSLEDLQIFKNQIINIIYASSKKPNEQT